jgi:hypothetical protein
MRGNFLATHIRHCFGFRVLPRLRRLLMCCMILPALVAPAVPGIRPSPKRGLLKLAADLAAVALAPVVRPADVESPATPAASHLEDHELVHPARKDENWTTASATRTVPVYWLSIRRLYTRVQAPTWTLLRFSAFATYSNASRSATFAPSSVLGLTG